MLLTAGGILYVTDGRRNIVCYWLQGEYYTSLIAGGMLYVTDSRRNIIRYW